MTKEEAIKEIKNASDEEVRYGDIEHHYEDVMKRIEAFEMAIKALEQESVLDKIRAEIMSKDGLEDALEIIDKHRAESEDEE